MYSPTFLENTDFCNVRYSASEHIIRGNASAKFILTHLNLLLVLALYHGQCK